MDGLGHSTPLRWRFAHCVFEESTLELVVAGVVVEIERKPLEVLRHLLRHAGEVVTKEELHAAVWPGRVLSDTVLTKAISRIRELLGDESQQLIKTVHGYGYRLIAPVSIEAAATRAPAVLGLKAGDSPPLRAQWKLIEHLSSGGSGEVWKVAHAKTGDVRVYKFAVSPEALNTLKREITLFRLLRQQLGAEAPVAEMLDWNLEEAPYFIELTHYASGNLALWAAARGGLAAIPLTERLAVFADIATAVSAVHGVGVLHKDLKASNVLMRGEGATVKPVLADFGGGGVLAEDIIANAGITRLGFTQWLDTVGQATALYLAPEVLEGQPQTIRGDVYALGVLLYQMVVGDFRKPVAPGWEQGVADELLRLDIAEAVQGNPAQRLASAALLAERIRQLEQRHAELATERAAQRRRAESQQALADLRLRRRWMLAAIGGLSLGLVFAAAQYYRADQQRQRAEQAAQLALDSGRFMIESLLPGFDGDMRDGTRNLTVRELLDSASAAADQKLATQPEIAFHVRLALSNAYNQVPDGTREAFRQQQLANRALRALQLVNADRAMALVPPEGLWITGAEDRELVRQLLATARQHAELPPTARLGLLGSASDAEFRFGSLQAARAHAAEAQTLAESLGDRTNAEDNIAFRIRLAREDADFVEAERLTPDYERLLQASEPRSPLNDAYFQADRGITRWMQGELALAAEDLDAGAAAVRALQPDSNWYSRFMLAHQIGLATDLGREAQRRSLTQQWLAVQQSTSPSETDMPGETLLVAEAAWRAGDRETAAALFEQMSTETKPGRRQVMANWARLYLALMRAEAGDATAARTWLARVQPSAWYDYRAGHPREALALAVSARLRQLDGQPSEAGGLSQQARALLMATYPAGHWRLRWLPT